MVTMVSPWSMVLPPTLPFSTPWEIGTETLAQGGMSQELAVPRPTIPSFANRLYQQAIPETGVPLPAPLKMIVNGWFWSQTTGTTWERMQQTRFAIPLPMGRTTCWDASMRQHATMMRRRLRTTAPASLAAVSFLAALIYTH